MTKPVSSDLLELYSSPQCEPFVFAADGPVCASRGSHDGNYDMDDEDGLWGPH